MIFIIISVLLEAIVVSKQMQLVVMLQKGASCVIFYRPMHYSLGLGLLFVWIAHLCTLVSFRFAVCMKCSPVHTGIIQICCLY